MWTGPSVLAGDIHNNVQAEANSSFMQPPTPRQVQYMYQDQSKAADKDKTATLCHHCFLNLQHNENQMPLSALTLGQQTMRTFTIHENRPLHTLTFIV